MERNLDHGFHRGIHGSPVIPFALLAEHGPRARQRAAQRALQGVSPEQHLERYLPLAEDAYRSLQQNIAGERTLTQAATSGGAVTGVVVDIAHSIMWLTETGRALEMMTVVPGLQGEWQGYYGNATPAATTGTPEGGDLPRDDPHAGPPPAETEDAGHALEYLQRPGRPQRTPPSRRWSSTAAPRSW